MSDPWLPIERRWTKIGDNGKMEYAKTMIVVVAGNGNKCWIVVVPVPGAGSLMDWLLKK